MKNSLKTILLALVAGFTFSACDKHDDDKHDHEGELITTLTLTMTDSANTADVVTATFRDSDGVGGNPPTIFNSIDLKADKTYHTSITVLDESKSPAQDITAEIANEKDEHQFFFTPSGGVTLLVKYLDFDSKNLPVGLQTKIKTGAPSSGKLRVTLKHQPGTKNNSIATGETDIEVDFPATVQ
ncbi:MAG TPA: hypothetical protein VK927_09315 [Adhaeribacter sp.]|nr:hypothetical protein [Adhaeribacter sp.]